MTDSKEEALAQDSLDRLRPLALAEREILRTGDIVGVEKHDLQGIVIDVVKNRFASKRAYLPNEFRDHVARMRTETAANRELVVFVKTIDGVWEQR